MAGGDISRPFDKINELLLIPTMQPRGLLKIVSLPIIWEVGMVVEIRNNLRKEL
jgi:hypothetical protein